MKIAPTLAALLLLSIPVLADTYKGIVSEVKHFDAGGVAVDMDGEYPNQKLVLYVPNNSEKTVGKIPPVGATVTATGTIGEHKGHLEMKIYKASQWIW